MAKKGLLVLVFAAAAAGGVFALPDFRLSAGAGGYFTSDFGGGVEASIGGFSMTQKTPYVGGGGFAFFDATYAELSVGFFGGGGTYKAESTGSGGGNGEQKLSYMGLDLGLLLKYPFTLSDKFSLFPLLGINYRIMLSVKDENGVSIDDIPQNGSKSSDFSALWFKLGGGLDFAFTDHIFLRGALTYGIRLANKFEKDMVDGMSQGVDASSLLGHGLDVKIAVGYRF